LHEGASTLHVHYLSYC